MRITSKPKNQVILFLLKPATLLSALPFAFLVKILAPLYELIISTVLTSTLSSSLEIIIMQNTGVFILFYTKLETLETLARGGMITTHNGMIFNLNEHLVNTCHKRSDHADLQIPPLHKMSIFVLEEADSAYLLDLSGF